MLISWLLALGCHGPQVDLEQIEVPDARVPGLYGNMAIDSAGHPVLAHYVMDDDTTHLLRHDGQAWVETGVAQGGGEYLGMALDADDRAVISHQSHADYHLRVLREQEDGSFDLAHYHPDFGTGGFSDVALDSQGHAVVVHQTGTPDCCIEVLWESEDDWGSQTIECDRCGSSPSLVLDEAGQATVAYFADLPSDLMVARQTDVGWALEIVDGEGGWWPQAHLDSQGRLVVAHADWSQGTVELARETSSGWELEVVDRHDEGFTSLSLDLDSSDQAVLAYRQEGEEDLVLAREADGDWEIRTIASQGYVGEFASLALLDDQDAVVSYSEWEGEYNGLLWVAWVEW